MHTRIWLGRCNPHQLTQFMGERVNGDCQSSLCSYCHCRFLAVVCCSGRTGHGLGKFGLGEKRSHIPSAADCAANSSKTSSFALSHPFTWGCVCSNSGAWACNNSSSSRFSSSLFKAPPANSCKIPAHAARPAGALRAGLGALYPYF